MESFNIEYCKADLGKRIVAILLDGVIVGFGVLIISTIFGLILGLISTLLGGGGETGFVLGVIIYYLLSLVAPILYFSYFESSRSQATIGKSIMNLKVVSEQGEKLDFSKALIRNLCRLLSGILLIGYILAFVNDNRQALHDMLAKTHVVDSNLYHSNYALVSTEEE